MLGGSVYNLDVFHIYYGINVTEFQFSGQKGGKDKRDRYETDIKFNTYQE